MPNTIEGIQGSLTVDKGAHDKDATVALIAKQNNVAHAPATVHMTRAHAVELRDALDAAIAALPEDAAAKA